MTRIEFRPGARVRYSPAHSDEWREGELVKPSRTGEEWLVKNRFGRFWIGIDQLRPPEEDGAQPAAAH